jgi:dihydrofolate reductase
MHTKVSVFIASSLDGFIARKDGNLDWLDNANTSVPEGEDFGYRTFIDSVDVLIMGRNTYEKVRTFGSWPYGEKRVVVLTRRPIEIPTELKKTVSTSSAPPDVLLKELAADGARHFYIDGGVTIQRFLAAGLIDEITITQMPVLLGEGIPLFGKLEEDVILTHVSTETKGGLVQNKYSVKKNTKRFVF